MSSSCFQETLWGFAFLLLTNRDQGGIRVGEVNFLCKLRTGENVDLTVMVLLFFVCLFVSFPFFHVDLEKILSFSCLKVFWLLKVKTFLN